MENLQFLGKFFSAFICRTGKSLIKFPFQSLGSVYHDKLTLFPPIYYVLKMMSAFYICCMYSSALQTRFFHGSKQYEYFVSLIWFQTICKGYQQMTKSPLAKTGLTFWRHTIQLGDHSLMSRITVCMCDI